MLTFLIVCEPTEQEKEREKKKNCCTHDTRVSSSPFRHIHIRTQSLSCLSPFPRIFFCLTRTLFRGFCVSLYRRLFFSSRHSRAPKHIGKIVICIFMPSLRSLSSHCLLTSPGLFSFFSAFSPFRVCVCVCVACTHVLRLRFLLAFFLWFYNANIMSAARLIDSRRLHALRSWKNWMAAATAANLEKTTGSATFHSVFSII